MIKPSDFPDELITGLKALPGNVFAKALAYRFSFTYGFSGVVESTLQINLLSSLNERMTLNDEEIRQYTTIYARLAASIFRGYPISEADKEDYLDLKRMMRDKRDVPPALLQLDHLVQQEINRVYALVKENNNA